MANTPDAHHRVAVLLHLAHHDQWHEIASYLTNLPEQFDLLVNLVRGMHGQTALEVQRERVLACFPDAWVTVSPNVGLDIGGTFFLLAHLLTQDPGHDYVLKLHSKSDPRWRRFMLNRLAGSKARCRLILAAFERDPSLGMLGSYLYPFDYMNLKYVLEYLQRFEVPINLRWDEYRKVHPEVRRLGVGALIAHSRRQGIGTARPDIDLEYYTAQVGDFNEPMLQPDDAARRRMRELGVMGNLPYYPGTCFWIRGSLLRSCFQGQALGALAQELETGWVSDVRHQTRTHAWERVYTMLAQAHGYTLAVAPAEA